MATQKRSSSGKRTTTGKKTTAGGRRTAAPKKRPIRREVGGVVCLVLALCIAFSYFQQGGWLLDRPAALCRGLVGYGYYTVAPVLLLVSYILLFHRGRNVTACVVGAALLPVLLGAMLHLVLCKTDYNSVDGIAKLLWQSGLLMESGGVLSATLAIMLVKLVKKTLAMILLAVLLVTCLMLAFRLTPAAVLEAVRSHERVPYEPEDDEEEVPPTRATATKSAEKSKACIDIPLDGETREPPKKEGKLSGFFTHKSDAVRTPDELLTAKAPAPEPTYTVVAGAPLTETVPAPARTPAAPVVSTAPAAVSAAPAANVSARPSAPEEVAAEAEKVTGEIESELEQDIPEYTFPPITLLDEGGAGNAVEAGAELRNNSRRLAETLKSFGVDARAGDVVRGPSVTRYEFTLDQGVKLSKITNLADDIALALGASGVRIAPIPDKISVVGIEVPNKLVSAVHIRDVLESHEFTQHKSSVAFAVGKDIAGNNIIGNIAKLPHVLIAGTTGSGKSVCTNSLIVSLLYKSTPDEVRFIMVDPKMVELAPYNGIPHLLIPVVTDPKKAVCVLNSLVEEMGRRLELCKMATARNIVEYNEKFVARRLNPQKGHRYLPYIVVIVDEFADLIMTAKAVEVPVMRLAQKARAVGIHLIIATQRPDVKVITGGIKANFPARIAFRVMQMIDSRTIIDQPGANQLIGRGDMLFSKDGELTRIQCALVETREVERLVDFIAKQPGYPSAYLLPDCGMEGEEGATGGSTGESDAPVKYDVLFGEIARAAVTNGTISTSSIQRNYEVGFNRAGRIMLQLERAGIVGPQIGAKPREIKFYDLPSLEAKLQELGVF